MSKQRREKRMSCCLSVWMSSADVEKLKEQAAGSTCGSFSEYVRRLLFGGKAVILYRNASLDSVLDEAIALRNEMALVRKTLPWTGQQEQHLITLQENIQLIITKIYELCKQK